MTRLWILSDLHLEQSVWSMPDAPDGVDVIVAAGDIHSPATRSVEWLDDVAGGIPVIFVPGNHEWYATRRPFGMDREAERTRRMAADLGVYMLMDDEIEVAGCASSARRCGPTSRSTARRRRRWASPLAG